VSFIACGNADETFMTPVVIMKGVRQNVEFSDGLPPRSEVSINPKSSYTFALRKCPGKTRLILDGHSAI